jgi:transcription initiation factor TFIID subunit 5
MLAAIRLAAHVSESEEGTRWRQERYNVRLSERGWGLLLGWLQGGGLAGSIEGTEARGRDRVLAIINERVKVEGESNSSRFIASISDGLSSIAVPGPPSSGTADFGLLSDYQGKRPSKGLDALILGAAPLDAKLQREIARQVGPTPGEVAAAPDASVSIAITPLDPSLAPTDATAAPDAVGLDSTSSSSLPPLTTPLASDLPPYPTTLRTIDVAREVEKVREARKRIKLGAEAFQIQERGVVAKKDAADVDGPTEASKPSVCLFTVHDAGDRLVLIRDEFESTLMRLRQFDDDAVLGGFYITRCWVLRELHPTVEPHWCDPASTPK